MVESATSLYLFRSISVMINVIFFFSKQQKRQILLENYRFSQRSETLFFPQASLNRHGSSKVLMVADKPSIALSIAFVLSQGQMSTRKGTTTDVHELNGNFLGSQAHIKLISVIGHVFRFSAAYHNRTVTDPIDLFEAPIQKMEANPKAHVRRHLSQEDI